MLLLPGVILLPVFISSQLPGTFTFIHYLPCAFTTWIRFTTWNFHFTTWNFHFHSLPTYFTFVAYLLHLNCSTSIAPPQLLLLNCSTSIAPPQLLYTALPTNLNHQYSRMFETNGGPWPAM